MKSKSKVNHIFAAKLTWVSWCQITWFGFIKILMSPGKLCGRILYCWSPLPRRWYCNSTLFIAVEIPFLNQSLPSLSSMQRSKAFGVKIKMKVFESCTFLIKLFPKCPARRLSSKKKTLQPFKVRINLNKLVRSEPSETYEDVKLFLQFIFRKFHVSTPSHSLTTVNSLWDSGWLEPSILLHFWILVSHIPLLSFFSVSQLPPKKNPLHFYWTWRIFHSIFNSNFHQEFIVVERFNVFDPLSCVLKSPRETERSGSWNLLFEISQNFASKFPCYIVGNRNITYQGFHQLFV